MNNNVSCIKFIFINNIPIPLLYAYLSEISEHHIVYTNYFLNI